MCTLCEFKCVLHGLDSVHVIETDSEWGVGEGGGGGSAGDHGVPSLQPWAEIRQIVINQSSTSGQSKGRRRPPEGAVSTILYNSAATFLNNLVLSFNLYTTC